MKTLFAKHKWMQLVYGVLLLTAGILTIVISLNNPDDISNALSIIISISLFIYAAALMFTGVFSLKEKYFDIAFLYSVVFVSVGVVLLCNREMIGSFITIFVATLITAFGVVEIGEATSMIFFKRPLFFIVMFYLLGAAFITLGVLAFVYQENVKQIVYVGIGVLLCLVAILELVLGAHGLILLLREKKAEKDNIIDSKVEEKKPEEEKKEEKPLLDKPEDFRKTEVIDLSKDDNDENGNSNPQA